MTKFKTRIAFGFAIALFTVAAFAADKSKDAEAESIESMLGAWVKAWDDNVNFMSWYEHFYHADFRCDYPNQSGMTKSEWIADKQAKAKKAGFIWVEISDVKVEIANDKATVRFQQKYVSRDYCDQGEKTVYLAKVDTAWRIIGEKQLKASKCSDHCNPDQKKRNRLVGSWRAEGDGWAGLVIRSDGRFTYAYHYEGKIEKSGAGKWESHCDLLLLLWDSGKRDVYLYNDSFGQWPTLDQGGGTEWFKSR
jgi:hypothetical protein